MFVDAIGCCVCHFKPACTPCALLYLLFVLATGMQAAVNTCQEGASDYNCTPAEEQTIFSATDETPLLNDTVNAVVANFTAVTTSATITRATHT